MTLKQKIQALLSSANSCTGYSDTTLTTAVQRLITGYGGGGGDVRPYSANVVPTVFPTTYTPSQFGDYNYFLSFTVDKDGNLLAGNIKKSISIFGVTGTFTDASTVSSGQTAAGASQISSGYSAWVNGVEVKGSMSSKSASDVSFSNGNVMVPAGSYPSPVSKAVPSGSLYLNTPSISPSTGVVTASMTVSAGYVSEAPANKTLALQTQSGKTVTPSTYKQTAVSSGLYTTGAVYVAGDSNLAAYNIKNGITIFGVTGTYEGGGGTDPAYAWVRVYSSGSLYDGVICDETGERTPFDTGTEYVFSVPEAGTYRFINDGGMFTVTKTVVVSTQYSLTSVNMDEL